MGKYHTPFRFQPSILTGFCFFAGIFAGTMWVNRMGAGLKEQLGVFGQAFLTGSTQPPSLELLAELLLKRSLGIGILWLLGMSLFAVPGFCLAAVYAGFSMAFLISSMTVQAGLMGVFLFLLSVFPQMIFYLPVLAVLYIWAMAPGNKIHGGGFAVLLILTAAGAASELWLNPWFLHFASGF